MYDEDGRFSQRLQALIQEVRQLSAEAGFYQMVSPKIGGRRHGSWPIILPGGTISPLWSAELAHALRPRPLGICKLLEQVTQEALERVMPGLLSGTESMCFGLSEPNAGSDAVDQNQSNTRWHGWRINGRKIWTTNAPIADYCVMFAVTDPSSGAKKRWNYGLYCSH